MIKRKDRGRVVALGLTLVGLALSSCSIHGKSRDDLSSAPSGSEATGNVYVVRFYLDGMLIKTLDGVKEGSKIDPPASELVPEGYVVNYWYSKEGGFKNPWSFLGGTVTSDIDLYADFGYAEYSVILFSRTGEMLESQVKYKQSYDFSSVYSESESLRLDSFQDEEDLVYPVSGVWPFTRGATLYPAWKTISSYCFLDVNGWGVSDGSLFYSYGAQDGLEGVQNDNPNVVLGCGSSLDKPLLDASKDGYRFEGWFEFKDYERASEGFCKVYRRLSSISDVLFSETTVYGLFSKWHDVRVSAGPGGEAGLVGESVSSACCFDKLEVQARPSEGYAFAGWYCDGVFVSSNNPYSFAMPSNDLALEARFMTKAEKEEEERRKALGIDPVIDTEDKVLTYGLYPQKRVSDSTTLASLNKLTSAGSNGWYLLNGEYYAKKEANPYSSSYVFDDGAKIVSGTTYWFKCDPIEWKILSSESGEYSLVSTALLDAHDYNPSTSNRTIDGKTVYPNNYEHSGIREWLNGDFYDSAFSFGDSCVLTTTVDNSASTTGSSSNPYACENTEDKVYLLSYQDYKNTSYFADDAARQCKTTDWARANGAYYSTGSSYQYNGSCLTRSPYSSNSNFARCVNATGSIFEYDMWGFDVNNSYYSVRPAIRIKVAQ